MKYRTLAKFFLARHRFKITIAQTRFGNIECYAADAESITDAEIAAGILPDIFAQGSLDAVIATIMKRDPKALESDT